MLDVATHVSIIVGLWEVQIRESQGLAVASSLVSHSVGSSTQRIKVELVKTYDGRF